MATKPEIAKPAGRSRADGRKQILLYMDEALIKALKSLAIRENTTAYELTEEAVKALLKARRERK